MNTQVERLEALLVRVQENRQRPRPAAAARKPAPAIAAPSLNETRRGVPAPAAPPVSARPAESPLRSVPAIETRGKPKSATPLELAVEEGILQPAQAEPPRAPAAPAPVVAAPVAPAPAAPRAARQAAAKPPPTEGVVLVDVAPTTPSKPIVQVLSPHPPQAASTFGELLRRSLSLRPR